MTLAVRIQLQLAVRPGAAQPVQGVLASLKRQLPSRQPGVLLTLPEPSEAALQLQLDAPSSASATVELQRLAPTLGLLAPYTQVLQLLAWGSLGAQLQGQLKQLHPEAVFWPEPPSG